MKINCRRSSGMALSWMSSSSSLWGARASSSLTFSSRRRARRIRSIALLRAVVVIQAPGFLGSPRFGQTRARRGSVLDGLLGEVEVAVEHADEHRDRPSRLLPEQAVDGLGRNAYLRASDSLVWSAEPAAS